MYKKHTVLIMCEVSTCCECREYWLAVGVKREASKPWLKWMCRKIWDDTAPSTLKGWPRHRPRGKLWFLCTCIHNGYKTWIESNNKKSSFKKYSAQITIKWSYIKIHLMMNLKFLQFKFDILFITSNCQIIFFFIFTYFVNCIVLA
jgi:hypothetical protein